MTTNVYITVANVGTNFGHVGQVRSAKTNRVLATTRTVPYGMQSSARGAAMLIAHNRGYNVVKSRA